MTDQTTERLINRVLDLQEKLDKATKDLYECRYQLKLENASFEALQKDVCDWSDKLSDKPLSTELKTLVSDR